MKCSMCSVECVKCKVKSAECRVYVVKGVEFKAWSVVWSVDCEV